MIGTSLRRDDAVKQLSNHVADRDRFLIAVSLRAFAQYEYAFAAGSIAGWTAYVDMGGPSVMRTESPGLLSAFTRGQSGSLVLAVPKTVPAAVLGAVFGQDFPEDGSRDLIDLDSDFWPSLVFDALETVSPSEAAQIRAAYPANGRIELPHAL